MAIRDDISISWELSPRIIEVTSDSTAVTIQELVNACRHLEAGFDALDDASIIAASGKEFLTEELRVGITLKLLNAKLKFKDRLYPPWIVCAVSGGNLVAVDVYGYPMNPIEPADYVTVTLAQSSSAAILDIDAIKVQTDKIPEYPAASGDEMALTTAAYQPIFDRLTEQDIQLVRVLGLGDENAYTDQVVYDGNNRPMSARHRAYDSPANAQGHGAAGLVATHTVTITYSGDSTVPATYLMVLD